MSKTTTAADPNDDTAGWYITKYDGTLDFTPLYSGWDGSPEIYRTKLQAVEAAFHKVRQNNDFDDPELEVATFHANTGKHCIESVIRTPDDEPVLAVGRVEYSD